MLKNIDTEGLKSKAKIVAAISGGVDSSVAAAIFKELDFEVIGATLRLKSCDTETEKTKACCGIDDDLQARAACQLIDIPHYFIDGKKEFEEKVLKYSWNEYKNAHTPNPCIMCNLHLKWGRLLDYATQLGADAIITGHYAKIIRKQDAEGNLIALLQRGDDILKDQSYFLAFLTQEQLLKTYFPLGNMTKSEVREYADKINLPNKAKIESQDACFGYAGEAFSETLRKRYDSEIDSGDFINTETGKIIGQHKGIHLYTIGQRKGLGISLGVPAYVSKIDYDSKEIFVTTNNDFLFAESLTANNINWQNPEFKNKTEFPCEVQIRYCHKPVKALAKQINDNEIQIDFKIPQRAVTKGQAAVFYSDNIVIGGGWIK